MANGLNSLQLLAGSKFAGQNGFGNVRPENRQSDTPRDVGCRDTITRSKYLDRNLTFRQLAPPAARFQDQPDQRWVGLLQCCNAIVVNQTHHMPSTGEPDRCAMNEGLLDVVRCRDPEKRSNASQRKFDINPVGVDNDAGDYAC